MIREAGDSHRVQPFHEGVSAHELECLHRRDVEGIAERFAQAQWSVMPVAVVVEGVLAAAHGFGEFGVVDQGGRGPPLLERERIKQRLHGRTRLPRCEHGVIADRRIVAGFIAAGCRGGGRRGGCTSRRRRASHHPTQDFVAPVIDDEHRTIMDVPLGETGECAIEDLLSGELYVRIERGTDLCVDRSGASQVQRVAHEMAGVEGGLRVVEHPGVAVHLGKLGGGQCSALLQSVREPLEGAARSWRIAP
jgi:hypothetical protein